MEIPTKTDFVEMEQKLTYKLDALLRIVATNTDVSSRVLNSTELINRLNISRRTFHNNRVKLIRAGMYKDGQWKMRESDLENYISNQQTS